jgi:hypothetical protein
MLDVRISELPYIPAPINSATDYIEVAVADGSSSTGYTSVKAKISDISTPAAVGVNQIAYGNSTTGVITSNSGFKRDPSTGFIGVNQSSPSYQFDVTGKARISQSMGIAAAPETDGLRMGASNPVYFGSTNSFIFDSGDSLITRAWNKNAIKTNNIDAIYTDNAQLTAFGHTSPTARIHVKGIGTSNSTFGIKTEDGSGNALFQLTDNGVYNMNSRLDGTSSGNPNYKHITNSGGLRSEYHSDPGYGSQLVFMESATQKGSVGCVSGITVLQGTYRVALKDQNTNLNKLWVDNVGSAYVGVGNDYFSPDAMFHANGTGTTSGQLCAKFGDSANLNIIKMRNDGYVIQRAKDGAITDGSLANSELCWYLDEASPSLISKVKLSTGVVKTVTLPLI